MVTKAEWDELQTKIDAWARWRTEKLGLKLERPICNDCRQPIEPWELRETMGENVYHSGRCGPMASGV